NRYPVHQVDAYLVRRQHAHTLDLLDIGMAGEGVRQPLGQFLVQDLQPVRQGGDVLDFREKGIALGKGWRRTLQVGDGDGKPIPILDLVARELAGLRERQQEESQAKNQKKAGQEPWPDSGPGVLQLGCALYQTLISSSSSTPVCSRTRLRIMS